MTFQRSNQGNKITMNQGNKNPQAGVTLLLSILVLSAIVAISFSFASIILVEIRSSGDVARTEPAFYAVQGVVEETIFKIKRAVPDTLERENDFFFGTCGSDTVVSAGAQVTTENQVGLTSGLCDTNPDADVTDIIPPTSGQNPANTQSIYNLYDPSNPYTNQACVGGKDPECSGGSWEASAYSKVEFHHLANPGGGMYIYFCAADKDCFTDGWDAQRSLNSGCVEFYDHANEGPTGGCVDAGNIEPDKAYQFFVVNTSSSTNAGIQIKSWGPDPVNGCVLPCTTAKGLPVFGQFSVNVTASYLGLTRKYQVNIPQ